MKKGMILLILSSFLLVGCDSIKMDKLAANNNERVKTIANDLIGDIDLSLYFDGTKDEQNPKIEQQEILVDGDEILGQYRKGRVGSVSTHSIRTMIVWHYKLYREAEDMGILSSLFNTGRNLVFGFYKKKRYVRRQ